MAPLSSVITCLDCLQNELTISDRFFDEANCLGVPLMVIFIGFHSNLFGLKKQILGIVQIFNNVIYSTKFDIKYSRLYKEMVQKNIF